MDYRQQPLALWNAGFKGDFTDQQIWSIVLYLRHLTLTGGLALVETRKKSGPSVSATYVASKTCQRCHAEIYQCWQKTPMANVVRDPREHPDAIIPDVSKPAVYHVQLRVFGK
jgi:hypothetical protein